MPETTKLESPFGANLFAFTLLLAALTALTALSIDMSLPAVPFLQRTFHASASGAQLTLSLFLLGYACGQLMNGPLSDRWGRRPVLLIGVTVFTMAGWGCAISPTLPVLVACRFLQGLGASVGPILARAMVRDRFEAQDATAVLSHITQVMMIAPLVAPTLGAFLLGRAGWPAIFSVLAASGLVLGVVCWFGLRETRPEHAASTGGAREVWQGIRGILSDRASLRFMLVVCFAYSGMFAYISGCPFVYMEVFGISKQYFGYYFALTAASLMVGATVNRARLRRQSPLVLLGHGVTTLCVSGLLLVILAEFRVGRVWGIVIPMMGFLFGLGLVMPNATAAAMAPHGKMAGISSSLIGGMQTAGGALAGACVGAFFDRTPTSLAVTVAILGVLSALTYGRRRANDPAPVADLQDASAALPLVPDEL